MGIWYITMSHFSPVLLAEDNPNDAFLVCRAFKENQTPNPVQSVQNGDEAIQYLAGEGCLTRRRERTRWTSRRALSNR
jgi:hypothetical protein